ncbi:MAG: glycosyltransferase [Dehalococcoidia bacterium]|nr:MAG: glycosyltransferase [Dehalococcoidia bacterium]
MFYQQLISFLLVGILLNLLLNLRALRKAKGDGELPDAPPPISVLIPVRNEEDNIGTCLESLRRQDYPNVEILVLDDASTDGTADIVARIAAEDPRVRLLQGQPLPSGWAGKPFACQQLANEARGSWLLFTDADTVHAPAVLRHVLCAALGSGAALISGFPHQRTTSIWQKMAIPIMFYFMILCWMPLWWMQRSRRTLPSVAIGQFMFFSAQEYRSIGGHEAVKSRILEDVWLGREMARHHYRQLTLDLSPLVSCQMYREFGTMWDGINRWLYVAASLSIFAFIGIVGVVLLLFLAPFLWLAHGLLLAQPAFGWQVLVMLQVAILYLARFLVGRRFSQSKSSVILHPIGMAFLLLVCLYASYRHLRGAGIRWKGRVYGPESQIG